MKRKNLIIGSRKETSGPRIFNIRHEDTRDRDGYPRLESDLI